MDDVDTPGRVLALYFMGPSRHLLAPHLTGNLYLPEAAKDVQWERGWRILPTKHQLQRWGLTVDSACPNCGRPETAEHAVASCAVAKAFWRLVHRAAPGLQLAEYYARSTCRRDALGTLLSSRRICVVEKPLQSGWAKQAAAPTMATFGHIQTGAPGTSISPAFSAGGNRVPA